MKAEVHGGWKGIEARRKNDMVWRKLEFVSYSAFVDNLPMDMDKAWLWQVFKLQGKVVDIYMSRKKHVSTKTPFAFVRLSHLKEVQATIENPNGTVIRECKIRVSMAEYRHNTGHAQQWLFREKTLKF